MQEINGVLFLIFNYFSLYFDLPTELILSAGLFPVKSPVANQIFCSFLNNSFRSSISSACFCFFAVYINLLQNLSPNFLGNDKKSYPCTYFLYFGSHEYLIFTLTCSNY